MKINEIDIAYLIVLGIFCFKIHNQDSIVHEGRKVTSQILTRPGYKAKQIWLPSHNMASDFTDGSARNTNIDKERIESKGDEFNCQGSSFQ